jgi:predicted NUDIX family NTP pyrophosphohydrolase
MAKQSAGLIMYRWRESHLEIFLIHPGGPFWANKDKSAWSVPKGEYADGEEPLEAAKREFFEETGFTAYRQFLELGTVKQPGGTIVTAWAFESDCDLADLVSNRFQLEWPPRSGRLVEFPEVDRGDWFSIPAAREHILKSQEPLLNLLCTALHLSASSTE